MEHRFLEEMEENPGAAYYDLACHAQELHDQLSEKEDMLRATELRLAASRSALVAQAGAAEEAEGALAMEEARLEGARRSVQDLQDLMDDLKGQGHPAPGSSASLEQLLERRDSARAQAVDLALACEDVQQQLTLAEQARTAALLADRLREELGLLCADNDLLERALQTLQTLQCLPDDCPAPGTGGDVDHEDENEVRLEQALRCLRVGRHCAKGEGAQGEGAQGEEKEKKLVQSTASSPASARWRWRRAHLEKIWVQRAVLLDTLDARSPVPRAAAAVVGHLLDLPAEECGAAAAAGAGSWEELVKDTEERLAYAQNQFAQRTSSATEVEEVSASFDYWRKTTE